MPGPVFARGARVRVRILDREPGAHADEHGTYPATVLSVGRSGLSAVVEYDHMPGVPKCITADFAQYEFI
jgi:hypothetical protein